MACAAFLLVFSGLSEVIGRHRLYVAGLALFAASAAGCALSRDLDTLLVFRACRAWGPRRPCRSDHRCTAPSFLPDCWAAPGAELPGGGHGIYRRAGHRRSGALRGRLAWLFALPVPIGVVAVGLAWRALPREPGRRGGFDAVGAGCSILALGALFLAMDGVGHQTPVWQSLGWLALSLVAGGLFLWRQRRALHPLLPLTLFRQRRFSLAVSASGLAFIGQGLAFVALSFLYQQDMGFSPLETAWLFTPWPLAIMVAGPLAGRLADRVNPSLLSCLGLVVLIVGMVALAGLEAEAGVADCLWRTALCGLGFGMFQPPNNRELMASVPAERSANASGVMSTTRTVGQAMGVAWSALACRSARQSRWRSGVAPQPGCWHCWRVSVGCPGQARRRVYVVVPPANAYNEDDIHHRGADMSTQSTIEKKLQALEPTFLTVENESHMHNVPPNAETHFKVTLVSSRFEGMMPVKRHQQIYALLADELAGPVHAWRCTLIRRKNGSREERRA